jgi:CRISPR system Cascade subunit CasE
MIASQLLLAGEDMLRLRLTDPYSLHRIVYDCFPAPDAAQNRAASAGFLYADNGLRQGRREIIMLSARKPRPPQYGELLCKTVPERFLDFDAYRFAITINPVRRQNATGKLIPLRAPEEVHAWFCAKSPAWGVSVRPEEVRVDEIGVWQFNKKNQPVTLGFAKVAGALHVEDRQLFRQGFAQGLGRAKAFGCGLLQLAPLPSQTTIS